jgi:PE-PPE domain
MMAGGLAAAAITGSVLLGAMPTLQGAQVTLTATTQAYYLRGTNIGRFPSDTAYAAFADGVIDATAGPHLPAQKVDYPAAFWPASAGYLTDPTYGASVRIGLDALHSTADGQGNALIYGYSQGAVVATRYKRETVAAGNTYVLVANPNRPNGGILQRFNGITIPILDVPFNGATPTGGDLTYDIARQYDGWADFPNYPLNLLATVNALLGIAFLHGMYDVDIDPAVLNDPSQTDVSQHGNTTYYLIHTDRLPLLMPLQGVLPDRVLDRLDKPLRVLVELGYDRTDYGKGTGAGLINPVNPVKVVKDLVDAIGPGGDEDSTDAAAAPTRRAADKTVDNDTAAGRSTTVDVDSDAGDPDAEGHDPDKPPASAAGPKPKPSLRDRWSARKSALSATRPAAGHRSERSEAVHANPKQPGLRHMRESARD